MDSKEFRRRSKTEGRRDTDRERSLLTAKFRDERLHIRFGIAAQSRRQFEYGGNGEHERDEQEVLPYDEERHPGFGRGLSEPSELHDEEEHAEGRHDAQRGAECRGGIRIDETEDHRTDEDAGEDLADHRRLMELLHDFPRGAGGDEDEQ